MGDRRSILKGLGAGAALGALAPAGALPRLAADNRGMSYEKAIRGNGWVEINAQAFEFNLSELERTVGTTPVCVVVKADAYGHGLDLLMPTILRRRVAVLGIASNEEARIARSMGFRGRILRLRSATGDEMEDAMRYRVEELVGNPDYAQALDRMAQRRGVRVRTHLMLNSTGMSRNGLELSTADGRAAARDILGRRNLQFVALMSHFPVEEAGDVRAGLARFNEDSEWLYGQAGVSRTGLARHVANSFATLNVPEARLDMVRCGATLYDDLYGSNFRQVMSLKSRVASINPYPRGNTVAYDRTHKLERDSWLANIPMGYSDGYRRIFSHGNQVPAESRVTYALVRGHRVPIVGRVTMNTLMLDVTDVRDEVRMGDEVVFLGQQGGERIGWADLEKWSGTITEDLETMLGDAVPRVLAPAPAGTPAAPPRS
jgi:alanine racemase